MKIMEVARSGLGIANNFALSSMEHLMGTHRSKKQKISTVVITVNSNRDFLPRIPISESNMSLVGECYSYEKSSWQTPSGDWIFEDMPPRECKLDPLPDRHYKSLQRNYYSKKGSSCQTPSGNDIMEKMPPRECKLEPLSVDTKSLPRNYYSKKESFWQTPSGNDIMEKMSTRECKLEPLSVDTKSLPPKKSCPFKITPIKVRD